MRAYVAKSFYLAVTGRANEALRAADAGLAIDPNSAQLLDARTLAEIVLGRFEQAKSDAQQAMRLSPRDLEIANRVMNLGMAELGLGNFDAAIVQFQKAIDAGNRSFIPYVNLAAAYALEGKTDEAKAALGEARGLNAQLTVKWLIAHAPSIPPLFDGLRKGGAAGGVKVGSCARDMVGRMTAHPRLLSYGTGAKRLILAAGGQAPHAHSPLRNTGARLPSAWTPSMSISPEPIIQSMWMRLLLPPCAAICSGVSFAPSRKHFE